MIPLSHMSFVQRAQVKFRPKTKVKIKISHSVVAVGTVGEGWGWGGGAAQYLRRSKWKVGPMPLLWLSYAFLIRNWYPFIVGLT